MNQENFSPEQSLRLIRNMISRTREDISSNAAYFLIWGWLTFICCVGQFILKRIMHYEQHYLVWWLVLFGVVYTVIYSMKKNKGARVKTYVGDSMKYLWIGMGISYFVLSFILSSIGWNTNVFPFFIMLYGLGTFVSGYFIRFRPLIIGGEIAWGLAIGSTFVEYDFQILCAAAAILASYIIPAYLLRVQEKNSSIKSSQYGTA